MKTTYRKSWAANLFMWSDLTLGPSCLLLAGRQVPIFSYYFLFFNKFLFIPIFQENSYFFLFLVMIMYFKSLNVVDHMEND